MRDFLGKDGNRLPIGQIEVNIVYQHIDKALRDGYKTISEQGGTRSGKSVNTMAYFCLQARIRKLKVCILRKTYPTLRMSILQDFIDVMMQFGVYKERNFNKTEHVYRLENGSEFHFVAADESEKLKGLRGDIIWLNEATEFEYEDFYQLNFRAEKLVVLDYNPNFSSSHWLAAHINHPDYADDYTGALSCTIEKEKRKEVYFFITTYRDNPFLEARQVEQIEKLKNTNYTLWLQYGQGQRCVVQGRVFPSVDIVDGIPENSYGLKSFVGIDYGYSNQPTAIAKVWLGRDDIYVEEVAYKVDLRTDEIRKILCTDARVKGLPIVADSANELINREVEEIKDSSGSVVRKLPIRRVNKGGLKSGLRRIEAVRTMQQFKIHVFRESANAAREFSNYSFKPDKAGGYTNTPVEFDDHLVDAVRYVVMEFGSKRLRHGIVIH